MFKASDVFAVVFTRGGIRVELNCTPEDISISHPALFEGHHISGRVGSYFSYSGVESPSLDFSVVLTPKSCNTTAADGVKKTYLNLSSMVYPEYQDPGVKPPRVVLTLGSFFSGVGIIESVGGSASAPYFGGNPQKIEASISFKILFESSPGYDELVGAWGG